MGLKGSFSSLLQTLFCGLSVLLNLWLDFGACVVLQHLGFEGSLSYEVMLTAQRYLQGYFTFMSFMFHRLFRTEGWETE